MKEKMNFLLQLSLNFALISLILRSLLILTSSTVATTVMAFNLILAYIIKKLIMEFLFHQIYKKNGCNHTFPFKVPLSVFSDQGVCLLSSAQKRLFRSTCLSCGTCTEINFEQMELFRGNK